MRPAFENRLQADQIISDAEADLQAWTPNLETIHTQADAIGSNLMPLEVSSTTGAGASDAATMSPQSHTASTTAGHTGHGLGRQGQLEEGELRRRLEAGDDPVGSTQGEYERSEAAQSAGY